MLKSSSLCLYSSNLGTFWLKIEQFWPFEEISIFSNGGHLGYMTALTDTFERRPPKDHFSKVWLRLAQQFQRRRFFLNFIPPFFSNLHNQSKWVMGFTSKLQGRQILTCCTFLQFKVNLYLLQFLKYKTKSIKMKKKN